MGGISFLIASRIRLNEGKAIPKQCIKLLPGESDHEELWKKTSFFAKAKGPLLPNDNWGFSAEELNTEINTVISEYASLIEQNNKDINRIKSELIKKYPDDVTEPATIAQKHDEASPKNSEPNAGDVKTNIERTQSFRDRFKRGREEQMTNSEEAVVTTTIQNKQ